MKVINRALVGVVLVGAAAIASAQIDIAIESAGTWSGLDAQGNWSQSEAVLPAGSITAPLPMPTSMALQSNNGGLNGVVTYTDAGGDQLMLDLTFTSFVFDASGNFYSTEGNWVYGGGTGAYGGRTGTGTFAISQWNFQPLPSYSGTVLVGELTPEPSSFAICGLGLVGLMLRRRKK